MKKYRLKYKWTNGSIKLTVTDAQKLCRQIEKLKIQLSKTKEQNLRKRIALKYDATLIGTIKTFLNGWSIEFHKNGTYYLKDPSDHIQHFCSHSNREKMFSYLQRIDKQINFASKQGMGEILFAFTSKPNKWLNYKK